MVYAATKHAVRVISEGLRMEVKPYNIRTTVISPGAVATELPGHNRPEIIEQMAKRFEGITPLAADDIARAIVFAIGQPANVSINEVLVRPSRQAF